MRSSSTVKYRLLPSADHSGEPTARSSDSVSNRAVPPAAGISASFAWSYAYHFASSLCR